MNRFHWRRGLAAAAAAALVLTVPVARADMTQEQVQELLNELKLIRQALERGGGGGGAPAAPVDDKVSMAFPAPQHVLGDEKAQIVVVEYSDYQCPFCQQFHNTAFPQLKANYIDTGKIKFVSRDFPLDFHENARRAATAARCAGEQGKYWELRHVMIVNADQLKADQLMTYAANVKLDVPRFKACLDSDKYRPDIDKQTQEGMQAGVNGTPSFVIGTLKDGKLEGVRLVGAQPYGEFDVRLQQLIAQLDKK
jgi:protein-disulfide isomerase